MEVIRCLVGGSGISSSSSSGLPEEKSSQFSGTYSAWAAAAAVVVVIIRTPSTPLPATGGAAAAATAAFVVASVPYPTLTLLCPTCGVIYSGTRTSSYGRDGKEEDEDGLSKGIMVVAGTH